MATPWEKLNLLSNLNRNIVIQLMVRAADLRKKMQNQGAQDVIAPIHFYSKADHVSLLLKDNNYIWT